MNRATHLNQLRTETFDVCIIGAGATGAGCALDAASRGLKTALIEKDDFGSATSSTSTKLVHGGVRYLEQAFKKLDFKQFALVRKALLERQTLLRIAPHLAHPLALVTPCANWFDGLYFTIGLKLYDLMAGERRLEPSRWLSKDEALQYFPAFNRQQLHSAVLYYDGQFDDARLNLALAQTAARQGATVVNHAQALHFQTNEVGNLQSVTVRDELAGDTFIVKAALFINATGTHADTLRQDANGATADRMRASKGAHVVMTADAVGKTRAALLVPKTADGRVLFAIPWRGHYLIGTTDTEAEPDDEPLLLPEEADYLIEHVNHYLAKPLSADQITGGFAGLRPLLQADPTAETQSLVRDHEVEVDPKSGLISIMGGKWTTYRLMAEETIDCCCQLLNKQLACRTETLTLVGGEGYNAAFIKNFQKKYPLLPHEVVQHLTDTYGVKAGEVADLIVDNPDLGQRLAPGHPFVKAEVIYAIRAEMAQTLPDVLVRRIRLGLVDWRATLVALPETAALLSTELNWSAEQKQHAESAFKEQIEKVMATAGLGISTIKA